MLGELSGLRTGEGDVRVEGRELPTPSLIACRAFKELLEKVVVFPPLPAPLAMPLMGECMPGKEIVIQINQIGPKSQLTDAKLAETD